MRKTLLVITVLLVATQAYAGTVTMSVGDEGSRWAAIRYSADANVSGFALKVTADSGANFTEIKDYNVGECTATVQGYGIFPGTIDINDITGLVDNNGTPIAPSWDPCDHVGPTGLATNTLILEMGALYVDSNAPALSGTLILVKVNSDCNVCVETEPVRGNIVLTDSNEAIVIYSPNCVSVFQIDNDFGDAPNSYLTLLASNGPRHVAIGPRLGTNRDTELDGQPSANCDLDDNTGVPDDEDGITNLVANLAGGSVDVNVSATCLLNAWIDFNNDGDFIGDAVEQIFTNQPLVAGPNTLTFAVPAGAVVETDLVSRWRVSTAGSDSYEGAAADGEVEDYREPNIVCHVPDVVGDPCDDAIAELIANGFTIGNVTTEINDAVPYNYVISTTPGYCNEPPCLSPVDVVVSEGSDCYLGQADEAKWTEAGRPICWCYPKQCHGDADGDSEGSGLAGYWWVGTPDMDIMSLGWMEKDPPKGSGVVGWFVSGRSVACADFNRDKEGSGLAGYWRIGTPDIDIMSLYWMEKEPPKGSGTPADCSPGNRAP